MCATSSVLPLMKDHEDESQRGMDSFVSGYKAPTFPRQISDFAAAEQQNDEPSGNRGMATGLAIFLLSDSCFRAADRCCADPTSGPGKGEGRVCVRI